MRTPYLITIMIISCIFGYSQTPEIVIFDSTTMRYSNEAKVFIYNSSGKILTKGENWFSELQLTNDSMISVSLKIGRRKVHFGPFEKKHLVNCFKISVELDDNTKFDCSIVYVNNPIGGGLFVGGATGKAEHKKDCNGTHYMGLYQIE